MPIRSRYATIIDAAHCFPIVKGRRVPVPNPESGPREVILYRMVLPTHTCPYGLLAKRMLEDSGMQFDDRLLTTREEVDAFMAEHGVDTTPQIFIDGKRIGGSEELASHLEGAVTQA
jgi:glutaredoxin 3